MPLQKGHSPEVIRSNVHEMVRSGYKPKQAIAASLASARKFKKMAQGGPVTKDDSKETLGHRIGYPGYSDGGQVVAKGGMGDVPDWQRPKGGDDEPMSKMDEKGPEDYQRDIYAQDMQGNYDPSEVANPNEMNEAQMFASALRKKAMSMASTENPEGEMDGYAMGGLVQDGPAGDEPVGNKPSEDMDDTVEDVEVGASVGKPFMKEPSGMGLSEEAKRALKMKKMTRRFA